MKIASTLVLFALCYFSSQVSQGQNQRSKVVVSPYTIRIYNVDANSNPTTEITSSSSLQENTLYHVTVSTTFSGAAGILCRLFDGFEAGLWYGGSFVPYNNSAQAQGDGNHMSLLIRTFSGWDYVTPLSMRVYQCDSSSGSCANPGGAGWITQKLVAFP